MERKLTDFQTHCESRLAAALAEVGKSVSDRQLGGETETYIQGRVSPDLIFWIYENGADFGTRSEHPLFERPDFESLDELAEAFASAVIKSVK